MKALSMWQPWASLWLSPFKVHETRDWPTKHRGWLAVHASKRLASDVPPSLVAICEKQFGFGWKDLLPYGAVIGAVYVEDCGRMDSVRPAHQDDEECGIWTPARFAFRRGKNYQKIEPAKFIGRQKFFDIPDLIVPSLPYIVHAASGLFSHQ